jgi:hypothetical protein
VNHLVAVELRRVLNNLVAQVGARLGSRASTAAVCFTQRFGSRLEVNPHLHRLVPEAVFVEDEIPGASAHERKWAVMFPRGWRSPACPRSPNR